MTDTAHTSQVKTTEIFVIGQGCQGWCKNIVEIDSDILLML